MEPETLDEVGENDIRKICGLDLILSSINCEKYFPKFVSHGINEHTMLHLSAEDLRTLDVDEKDIDNILSAVNVLNKTLNLSEIRLSNDEVLKLQSNISGQLGTIALMLNHIFCSLTKNEKHFKDVLIDDCLSSVEAAMMVKRYFRAEEDNIEKSLKRVYKMKNRRILFITTTVCTLSTVLIFGFALGRRLNFLSNTFSSFSNYLPIVKNW